MNEDSDEDDESLARLSRKPPRSKSSREQEKSDKEETERETYACRSSIKSKKHPLIPAWGHGSTKGLESDDNLNFSDGDEKTRSFYKPKICDQSESFQNIELSADPQFDDNTRKIKKLKIEAFEKTETIENINNNNFKEKTENLKIKGITELCCANCFIKFDASKIIDPIETLKHVSFNKCDGDFYKIFINQTSIEKITIINEDQTFDGFSHEDFNELMKKLTNVKHLVLKGAGTLNYFDHGNHPFELEKLETEEIFFSRKVTSEKQGSEAKMDFLKSQKKTLKELRINKLPINSDGREVIKYIIEEMNLLNFYYGDTALIKNGNKNYDEVNALSASAEQIHCCMELLKIFPGIKDFTLNLNETDLDIEETIAILSSEKESFKNIKEMKVIDKSGYMRLLNVFQYLFANLISVQKFILKSQDKNINAVLEYCLQDMKELVELHLNSQAPRNYNRLTIIRKNSLKLKRLFINEEYCEYARSSVFTDGNVEVEIFKEK